MRPWKHKHKWTDSWQPHHCDIITPKTTVWCSSLISASADGIALANNRIYNAALTHQWPSSQLVINQATSQSGSMTVLPLVQLTLTINKIRHQSFRVNVKMLNPCLVMNTAHGGDTSSAVCNVQSKENFGHLTLLPDQVRNCTEITFLQLLQPVLVCPTRQRCT